MKLALRLPPEILFGAGESRRAPEVAARLGRRVFLVSGVPSLEPPPFLEAVPWSVSGEPETGLVDEAARRCREEKCNVVVAIGGGSSIDTGKAAAALAANGGSALDYLEGVGGGRTLKKKSLPLVAIPTTAGSGSEATWNAVIRVPGKEVKRSLRSEFLLPQVAIVDPELAAGAPREVAAAAGLDALTHLIEAYVSTGAQPFTDALALAGIRMAARGLRAMGSDTPDPEARAAMSLAALWGGISLAHAGLGAVHGLAASLGGRAPIPHGVACACILTEGVLMNVEALQKRAPESPVLLRYGEIAAAMGAEKPTPWGAVTQLAALRRKLGIPTLGSFGVKSEDLDSIAAGSRGSSMKHNPLELTDEELGLILRAALARSAAPLP